MTAMAVDPAGGGADAAAIPWRHGGWYAPLITVRGSETADSSAMAARLVRHRRDRCPVIVDAGGGYGGAITLRLKDNNVPATAFNGARESTELTCDAANSPSTTSARSGAIRDSVRMRQRPVCHVDGSEGMLINSKPTLPLQRSRSQESG
jgi:hypothetical protein